MLKVVPDTFNFVHEKDLNFVYTATKKEGEYKIEWEENGVRNATSYKVENVHEFLSHKTWLIVEDQDYII